MLQALISSKTRIKLLLRFFLNSNTSSYLRDLASEYGESTNAIRLELNRLEKAGLLTSKMKGNKKVYQANTQHSLFEPIHQLILKHTGIDHIMDFVLKKLQGLESAYVTGGFAKGIDSPEVDLLLVGNKISIDNLEQLVSKAEKLIKREINYQIVTPENKQQYLNGDTEVLLLWDKHDTLS
ncbi:MAG: winged helix-turn-helix domain-containing protein [Bacteroidales bacterium]